MDSNDGLVFGLMFDGTGGAKECSWSDIESWSPEHGILWMHLDFESECVEEWLREKSKLPKIIAEAITEDETRPRSVVFSNGLMLILRGVNMNPGADPEDMVAIRLWIEEGRVISMRRRKIMAVSDLKDELAQTQGPRNAGEFLVELIDRLSIRMGNVITDIEEEVDSLEDEILTSPNQELRVRIGDTRRKIIRIRRYLAPQREVTLHLQNEKVSWLTESHRMRLRDMADRVTRYVEDLDSAKDRASVVTDELEGRISDQTNKTMYILSVVAAIFLPLGLLTGLLGINVGGIPGTENPWAFTAVCILLVLFALILFLKFRKMNWI